MKLGTNENYLSNLLNVHNKESFYPVDITKRDIYITAVPRLKYVTNVQLVLTVKLQKTAAYSALLSTL